MRGGDCGSGDGVGGGATGVDGGRDLGRGEAAGGAGPERGQPGTQYLRRFRVARGRASREKDSSGCRTVCRDTARAVGGDDGGARRLAMAVVAGSEAEKLPVVVLFVERETQYLRGDRVARGRASRKRDTSGGRTAWRHTVRTAGGDDGGTRRLAMAVVAAKEAEKLPAMMLHAEKHAGSIEKLSRLLLALQIAEVHVAEVAVEHEQLRRSDALRGSDGADGVVRRLQDRHAREQGLMLLWKLSCSTSLRFAESTLRSSISYSSDGGDGCTTGARDRVRSSTGPLRAVIAREHAEGRGRRAHCAAVDLHVHSI